MSESEYIDIVRKEITRPEYANMTIFEVETRINAKTLTKELPITPTIAEIIALLPDATVEALVTYPHYTTFVDAIGQGTTTIASWLRILTLSKIISKKEADTINDYVSQVQLIPISRADELGIPEVGIGWLNLAGLPIPEPEVN